MPPPNLLCLAIDGWQIGYVGAYGNTHVATPEVDRFAAAGLVLDQAIVEAADLATNYRALWFAEGSQLRAKKGYDRGGASLATRLAAAGYEARLVTDEAELSGFAGLADFSPCVDVEYRPARRLAAAPEKTQLFRFVSQVGEQLAEAAAGERPFFLWAHAKGLRGDWDAPYELRQRQAEEDDPDPPEDIRFEPGILAPDADPDVLWGLRAAYAGQIALLDMCLGGLWDLLSETGLADNTNVFLLAPRGYPLGEHRQIGFSAESPNGLLHEEVVHVPWLIRLGDGTRRMARTARLARLADLPPTALAACGITAAPSAWNSADVLQGLDETDSTWRDHVVVAGKGEMAIRTAAWHSCRTEEEVKLFVKPDDRREVNDVAARCPHEAQQLCAAIEAYELAAEAGNPLAPLATELADISR